MDPGNRRAVVAALFANFGIAIAKFLGYLATGAASMLAEAVHSIADTTNQLLLLWGGVAAARTPTPDHPFGFGRERYFWSFIVSLVIFTLGGLFAVYEGVDKLLHPHALVQPGVAIAILVFGIGLEGYSFRTAIRESRRVKGRDTGWWDFVRRTKNPELPVILLEDLGALLGLSFALVGVSLAIATGDARYDALGSVVIGVLLIGIAVVLAIEMKSLIIGESASPKDHDALLQAIRTTPEVQRLISVRTQHLGPDHLLVCAKIDFEDSLSFRVLSEAIDRVEAAIRERVPIAKTIYIEPDVYDPSEDDGMGIRGGEAHADDS